MRTLILTLPLLFLACGCVPTAFLASERATYKAIAPEYLELVEGSDLTPEQKQSRRDTVQAWDMNLRQWEESEDPQD